MNGPRRLREGGGVSERLLDSASLDKPSRASRARAVELASTAGTFVTTTGGAGAAAAAKAGSAITRASVYRRVAMWTCIGAVAGGTVALIGTELLVPTMNPTSQPGVRAAAAPLLASEPDIAKPISPSPEPAQDIQPEPPVVKTVPPVIAALREAPPAAPALSSAPAPAPEVQAIEAASAAVAHGDSNGALRTLDDYDATHPNGSLKAESAALRVQAVSNAGNSVKAQSLANDFEKQYPTSPLRSAVRDAARLK
jgi:hypothetical protein